MFKASRFLKALATILSVVSLSLTNATALADDDEISISGLSKYTAMATDFTVNINNPSKEVCSMNFGDQTLTKAPWVFTIDPNNPDVSYQSQVVKIDFCDGTYDYEFFETIIPWTLTTNLEYLESFSKYERIYASFGSSVDEYATFTVTNSAGKSLVSGRIEPNSYAEMSFAVPTKPVLSKYVLTIVGETSGIKSKLNFYVANKWIATIGENTYEKCSTVLWSYSHKGAPKNVSQKSIRAEIAGAFARIQPYVGLTFKEAKASDLVDAKNTMQLNWDYPGPSTAAAVGGFDNNYGRTAGFVHLNPKHWWTKVETYKGFSLKSGTPGRGWLFVHEIMHALGMDHTVHKDQIMAPLIRSTKLGAGDIAGLEFLYDPKSCGE